MSFSEPVCIASSVGSESFVDHCSLEDRCGNFQELEQFWDEEKARLTDFDGQKPIVSSWEDKFLNDDSLMEPEPKKELNESYNQRKEQIIVKGETIKDIPTSYVISGFEPHELIVIGTYVDKIITPGFRYKVRQNLSNVYLFDGKALPLESIGLGYGKRITFKGDTLNNNTNYFWSDSRVHGFGFTLQTLMQQDTFLIMDQTGQIGKVVVNHPAQITDEELTTVVKNNGRVEKIVKVHFSCDVTMHGGKSNIFAENVEAKGVALLVRDGYSAMAKVEKIILENFVVDDCYLLPEE